MQQAFPLQSVLQLRELTEESRQRVFAQALYKLGEEQSRLAQFERSLSECNEVAEDLQKGALDTQLIGIHSRYSQWMQNLIKRQQGRVGTAHSQVERERGLLAEATKQRKMMETLSEKHLQSYQSWLDRLDQKTLDEIAVQMYERHRQVHDRIRAKGGPDEKGPDTGNHCC